MMLKGAEVWSDEKSKYIILRFSSQLSSTELFIFVSVTFTFVVYNVVLVIVPPSDVILATFKKYKKVPSSKIIQETAEKVLLSVEETKM